MDVLCAPSQTTPRWREQFGRMLIEAFASGVAVIASTSGEIPVRRRRRRRARAGGRSVAVAAGDRDADEDRARRCELARRGRAAGGVGVRLAGRRPAASRLLRARDRGARAHERAARRPLRRLSRRAVAEHGPRGERAPRADFDESHADAIDLTPVCPPFARRATRIWPARGRHSRSIAPSTAGGTIRGTSNGSRPITTCSTSSITAMRSSCTVCPPARTVVTCHDLDTFRSVLRPEDEPRSALFRKATRRILAGLQQAAWITCDTRGRPRRAARLRSGPAGAGQRRAGRRRRRLFAGRATRPPIARPRGSSRPAPGADRDPSRRQHHSAQAHRRAARTSARRWSRACPTCTWCAWAGRSPPSSSG